MATKFSGSKRYRVSYKGRSYALNMRRFIPFVSVMGVLFVVGLSFLFRSLWGNLTPIEPPQEDIFTGAASNIGLEDEPQEPSVGMENVVRLSPLPTAAPTPVPAIESTPRPYPWTTPISTDITFVENVEEIGYVSASVANVRSSPTTEEDNVILRVEKGDIITVVSHHTDDWTMIEVDGEPGYIKTDFVKVGTMPTPAPTPRYGKWDKEDYILLSTLIYCESGGTSLEGAVAVGWVVRNRLEDTDRWGDETWLDVISRSGQFSVYSTSSKSKFQKTLKKIAASTDPYLETSKRAARYVMQGRDKYRIPEGVQFFHANPAPIGWRSNFYRTIGDNDFFY